MPAPTRVPFASEGDLEPALASWAQQHLESVPGPHASFKIVQVRRIPGHYLVLVEAEARSGNRCSRELHELFIVNDDSGNARVAEESLYVADCCALDDPCRKRSYGGWMYYFARQQELGNDEALRRLVDPERGIHLAQYRCLGKCGKDNQPLIIQREEFGVAVLGSSWGVELGGLKYAALCNPGNHDRKPPAGAEAWTCGAFAWQKSPQGVFLVEINDGNIFGLRPGEY